MRVSTDHQSWLIVANGEVGLKSNLLRLSRNKKILALDGALNLLSKWHITPDCVLGDLDSVSPQLLKEYRQAGHRVVEALNQDYTDLEKGIVYLDQIKAQHISLCHASGGRVDHHLYNLTLLQRYYRPKRSITLWTENEQIIYLRDQTMLVEGEVGDNIAIMGFPQGKLTCSGLKYNLEDYAIAFFGASSICNELVKKRAEIHIRGEAIVILTRLKTRVLLIDCVNSKSVQFTVSP